MWGSCQQPEPSWSWSPREFCQFSTWTLRIFENLAISLMQQKVCGWTWLLINYLCKVSELSCSVYGVILWGLCCWWRWVQVWVHPLTNLQYVQPDVPVSVSLGAQQTSSAGTGMQGRQRIPQAGHQVIQVWQRQCRCTVAQARAGPSHTHSAQWAGRTTATVWLFVLWRRGFWLLENLHENNM